MVMKYLNVIKLCLLLFTALFCFLPISVSAQYFYVNTYLSNSDSSITSGIYKIDITSKRIVDSLNLGINGEFINKIPIDLIVNDHPILLSLLNDGLPGKNCSTQGFDIAKYSIIDKLTLRIIRQESLPNIYLYNKIKTNQDSIKLDWTDNSTLSPGYFRGSFIVNPDNYSFRIAEQTAYRSEFDNPNIIGPYSYNTLLKSERRGFIYWGLRDGLEADIFKTDNNNNILSQFMAGNKNISSILVGYNPIDSLIYVFKLRYYLETYAPPISSPDSVTNVLERFRPSDFSFVDHIRLPENPYIIANEVGNAEFINGCFVYYFSQNEDYRSFQPASLFIFDTRTNEATWLRVGWR
jgi:hypothetical protein